MTRARRDAQREVREAEHVAVAAQVTAAVCVGTLADLGGARFVRPPHQPLLPVGEEAELELFPLPTGRGAEIEHAETARHCEVDEIRERPEVVGDRAETVGFGERRWTFPEAGAEHHTAAGRDDRHDLAQRVALIPNTWSARRTRRRRVVRGRRPPASRCGRSPRASRPRAVAFVRARERRSSSRSTPTPRAAGAAAHAEQQLGPPAADVEDERRLSRARATAASWSARAPDIGELKSSHSYRPGGGAEVTSARFRSTLGVVEPPLGHRPQHQHGDDPGTDGREDRADHRSARAATPQLWVAA